ncbi:MAG: three-Cys-motif partner protein TcmP [Myxococcales bacterium]|nr:three-Cys-motif partner protein TcmP [Myxococcales bacterium]
MPRRTRSTATDLPEVGPWARDKLDRLRSYLSAYTTILSKQAWAKTVYIDAFAAAGRAALRATEPDEQAKLPIVDDAQALLDGSPRVALDIEPPFNQYVFIEQSPARLALLRELEREYAGRRQIRVHEGDCNEYLTKHVAALGLKKKGWRGVVFLDPYGMQVPWSTIEALAKTGALEVFINFPLGMAIQRLLKTSASFNEAERRKLDTYFGDPNWFDVVYQRQNADMFGEVKTTKGKDAARKLLGWYRARLKRHFGHVSPGYLVKNSVGGDLYYLLFAGPNSTGAKIASHVLGGGIRV